MAALAFDTKIGASGSSDSRHPAHKLTLYRWLSIGYSSNAKTESFQESVSFGYAATREGF